MVLRKDHTQQNYWGDALTVPISLLCALHKKFFIKDFFSKCAFLLQATGHYK